MPIRFFLFNLFPLLLEVIKRLAARVLRYAFKFVLDAHKLIVLADPVGAAHGAGLDLPGFQGHYQVGDKAVFGFA